MFCCWKTVSSCWGLGCWGVLMPNGSSSTREASARKCEPWSGSANGSSVGGLWAFFRTKFF